MLLIRSATVDDVTPVVKFSKISSGSPDESFGGGAK
jgi:hypothetical protein